MAKVLLSASIQEGSVVEASHVSQSIKAFTGTEDYDIKVSGSLTITGSTNILGTASANYFVGNGSQLTSIDTGSWNGIFSGSAEITGSLNVSNSPITCSVLTSSHTIFSGRDVTVHRRINVPIIRNDGSSIGFDGGINVTGSIIGSAGGTIDGTLEVTENISSSGGNLIGNKVQADTYFQGPETTERINLSVAGRADYIVGNETIVRMETNKVTINKSASFVERITASAGINVDDINQGAPAGVLKVTGSAQITGSLTITGSSAYKPITLVCSASGFGSSPGTSLPAEGGIVFLRNTRTAAGSVGEADLEISAFVSTATNVGKTVDIYWQKSSGDENTILKNSGMTGTTHINGAHSSNGVITVQSSSGTDTDLQCWVRIVGMGFESCSIVSNQTLSF
jgi:hypothetical protein